jgi:tRNA(fMet)-specific endonuclease VapC
LFSQDPGVRTQLDTVEQVFVPSIAIGELFYGAYKSRQAEENVETIRRFTQANTILAADSQTAEVYGQIKSQLRERGRPIPENDIWIAAIALQHALELAARDIHFAEVEGLSVLAW